MEARRGKQRQPAFQVENVILSLFLEAPVDFVYAAREGHFDSKMEKWDLHESGLYSFIDLEIVLNLQGNTAVS